MLKLTDANVLELVAAARDVRRRAYAPYSRYSVGAAVLTSSGRIYTGCNVENAIYGLTVCAEQVAVCTAVAAGEREIVAVAVATSNGAAPCGPCRQVLAEFRPHTDAGAQDMVVIAADMKTHRVLSLADLLPSAFGQEHLPHS